MLLCAYIYYFACCFNLILYFLIEKDKTDKNHLTSTAKSICQLQVFLQKEKKKRSAYIHGKEVQFSYTVANQITFEGKIYLIPLPSTVAVKISHKFVLTLNNITETVLQSVLTRNLRPDPVGFWRNCCSIKTELSFAK